MLYCAEQRGKDMGALIAFECVAPNHQADGGSPDKLTIHDRQWAFCPHGGRSEGHEWRETGGVDLDALRRRGGHHLKSSDLREGART